MKWYLENSNNCVKLHNKLENSISRDNFSVEFFNLIFPYIKSDAAITFRSDNVQYIDREVNKIISLCYSKNFTFDVANDNHIPLYKSKRIIEKKPRDNNIWYFTFSKLSYLSDNDIAYHFNFSKNKVNVHLILMLDNNMI